VFDGRAVAVELFIQVRDALDVEAPDHMLLPRLRELLVERCGELGVRAPRAVDALLECGVDSPPVVREGRRVEPRIVAEDRSDAPRD